MDGTQYNNNDLNTSALSGFTQNGNSPTKGVSVKKAIRLVEDLISEGQSCLRQYRREIDFYRQQIASADVGLTNMNEETLKTLAPIIRNNHDTLLSSVSMQKSEHQVLQKQLTDLKREKAIIYQQVTEANHKLDRLDESVGL